MRFNVETKKFEDMNSRPEKAAFHAADRSLSWAELKNLSDKICHAFTEAKIPRGYPVLIFGDKEAFFLAGILSCYRCGLTFVPVSPSQPKNRIEKIISLTNSEVMVVCGNYADIPGTRVVIDKDLNFIPSPLSNPPAENLAYILFTSGSSGEPKGVKITNRNIIAFTNWFVKDFGVNENTVFINQADFSFDISLADLFGALHLGATAIFNAAEVSAKTSSFFGRINEFKGTYWNSTPSFVSRCLADKNFTTANLPSIAKFVLSGENLSTHLVKDLKARFPKATILNAYGPTEATIYTGFTQVTEQLLHENTIPVCKADSKMISLKEKEIIISGETVGAGYLNNEILTRQRFVNNSFVSGDSAYEKNGYIYFAGRKDEQIKFNGYRIELNEIKSTLQKIYFVEQAECLPVIIDEKIRRLIAFVKLSPGGQISHITQILRSELPHYMIPSEIIAVKEFPLTASSKVDKQKLLQNYLSD
ncbi:MAG: AMP-binding protein [Bacteroidia bacterium]